MRIENANPGSPTMRALRLTSATLCIIAAAAVLPGGCDTPPKGSRGGAVDPHAPKGATEHASVRSLYEFSDQVAQELAQDLVDIDEIRASPDRLVLALGVLVNKTGTPTTDFEMFQTRIRSHLRRSDVIQSNFIVIQDPSITQRDMEHHAGGADDVARYDPALTYVLQGEFFESVRDDRRYFYMVFSLVNLRTNVIVFSSDYDIGQG
jgi:hypothetical protein